VAIGRAYFKRDSRKECAVKPWDKSELDDESPDTAYAWIVLRRRLRRMLLARSRRELQRPGMASRRIAVDQTLLLPAASHESRQ
jgi:hypothetical protein